MVLETNSLILLQDHYTTKNIYDSKTIKFYLMAIQEKHAKRKDRSGILLNKILFNDYTIEHICPQNPEDTPHSEEFEKNYLHLTLGNLALLTKSQNSQFSNKSFAIKQDLFKLDDFNSYNRNP